MRIDGQRLALGILVSAFAVLVPMKACEVAPRVPDLAALPTYSRVDGWLDSARCTLSSGAFLVSCREDGSLVAIEDSPLGLADDRGHGILSSVLALWNGAPVSREQLVWMHIGINTAAVLALALALWGWTGARLTAGVLLLAGPALAIPGPSPTSDAFASFFGAYCLGLIPVAWLAGSTWPTRRAPAFLAALVVAAFAAAWAGLLRQPLGMIGFLAVVVVLGARIVFPTGGSVRRRAVLSRGLAAAAVLFLAASWTTIGLVALRGFVWGVPKGERTLDHGISHNLYIGLGTEPNSFGVRWGDAEGFEAAQVVDPSTEYVTPMHYDALLRRWAEIVLANPWEVASIYMQKTGKTLKVLAGDRSGDWWPPILFAVSAVAAGFAVRRHLDPARTRLAIGVGAAALLVAAQGVLAAPSAPYLLPGVFAFQLAAVASADAVLTGVVRGLRLRRVDPFQSSPEAAR